MIFFKTPWGLTLTHRKEGFTSFARQLDEAVRYCLFSSPFFRSDSFQVSHFNSLYFIGCISNRKESFSCGNHFIFSFLYFHVCFINSTCEPLYAMQLCLNSSLLCPYSLRFLSHSSLKKDRRILSILSLLMAGSGLR
jgi:hypothetical protein